jgi:hypothetical protein
MLHCLSEGSVQICGELIATTTGTTDDQGSDLVPREESNPCGLDALPLSFGGPGEDIEDGLRL